MSTKRNPVGPVCVDLPAPDGGRGFLVPHRCLRCDGALTQSTVAVECSGCGARWPVHDGVPSYASAAYFGEAGQAEMRSLIQSASKSRWRTAVRDHFKTQKPDLYGYVTDLNRASWIPLLPLGPDSTVLDVGSGLGALTHALALNYERVVSMEPVEERVRFTRLRLEQEGITNVDLLQTTIDAMPFYDRTFDLIVLNGILEWVGVWRRDGTPRDVQLDVLRTLRRLLKPGGVLLVGIENRIGFSFFLGRVDHSGLAFTSLMPRWLASLYFKLRQPGFHRTLMAPSMGYRTYTYSPDGYRKLLGEAGFEGVDLWWPPNGYNVPHVMYRVADRSQIRETAVHECHAANRINGYALRRALKQRLLEATGLLYATVPDLVMMATAHPDGAESRQHNGSLIAKLQRVATPAGEDRAREIGPSHASVLMGHKLRNKSIIKFTAGSDVATGIAKVANLNLPRADAVEHAYQRLQRLHAAFESAGPPLSGSIPAPVTLIAHGPLIASVEMPASGVSLGRASIAPGYMADRRTVKRHLEIVAAWLVAAQPKLTVLQSELMLRSIPLEWRTIGETTGAASPPLSTCSPCVQHGDFFPTNVFLDERSGRLSVIDWDDCGAGYPPLFDWFCFVTGLYYTHTRVRRLPKGRTIDPVSFQQTFFEPSWLADTVVALTHRMADALHLDRTRIIDWFGAYLAVRYHQFHDDRDSGSKERWGRYFKDFHAQFLRSQDRCIFHANSVR